MATNPSYGRRAFLKDSVFLWPKPPRSFRNTKMPLPDAGAVLGPIGCVPPGAVDESFFLERCTKCGDCARPVLPARSCPSATARQVIFADRDALCISVKTSLHCRLRNGCVDAGRWAANRSAHGRGCHVSSRLHRIARLSCVCVQVSDGRIDMDFESLRFGVIGRGCVGCGHVCKSVCKTVNDHIAIRVTPQRVFTTRASEVRANQVGVRMGQCHTPEVQGRSGTIPSLKSIRLRCITWGEEFALDIPWTFTYHTQSRAWD
jgi:ferredoxin-type protein NapG